VFGERIGLFVLYTMSLTPGLASLSCFFAAKFIHSTVCEDDINYELKEIACIYNIPPIGHAILDFAKWMASYNMIYYGNVIKMLLLN
jgi:hypothetical protein